MTKKSTEIKNPFAAFTAEKDLETEGIWLDHFEGFRVKVSSSDANGSNTKYTKRLAAVTKKYKNLHRMNEYAQNKILAEVYADCIIQGWGVEIDRDEDTGECTYDDGKMYQLNDDNSVSIVEYNKENVVDCLIKFPRLFGSIRKEADNISNYQKDTEKVIIKN